MNDRECTCVTRSGERCRSRPVVGFDRCAAHAGPAFEALGVFDAILRRPGQVSFRLAGDHVHAVVTHAKMVQRSARGMQRWGPRVLVNTGAVIVEHGVVIDGELDDTIYSAILVRFGDRPTPYSSGVIGPGVRGVLDGRGSATGWAIQDIADGVVWVSKLTPDDVRAGDSMWSLVVVDSDGDRIVPPHAVERWTDGDEPQWQEAGIVSALRRRLRVPSGPVSGPRASVFEVALQDAYVLADRLMSVGCDDGKVLGQLLASVPAEQTHPAAQRSVQDDTRQLRLF